ncbi:hypothetical protein ASG89_09760 [Paenibacillus sp. Soil766]|nr:hypothetical protein ASG89_09760 [Paenibacillus sp. Soil766]
MIIFLNYWVKRYQTHTHDFCFMYTPKGKMKMDTNLYVSIGVKLTVALIGLLIMTRLLGKKEISQLTAFDFVSSLMLSELVGNTIYDNEIHLSHLLFALVIWTLLAWGLEKFIARFPRLSRYAAGTPDLIIRNGVVDFKAMKRYNLDFAQLGMLLRERPGLGGSAFAT